MRRLTARWQASAVAKRKVEQHPGGRRAAVRAGEQVPLLEQLEVTSYRGLGDTEARSEVGDRHRTAVGEFAQDQTEALFLAHGS